MLDRTSGTPVSGTPTRYRLQKLDTAGNVLGVATFTLPGATQAATPETAALAVESGSPGRVHLLLNTPDGSRAREVVAWSTAVSGGKLGAPAGLTADALSTPTGGSNAPGVVASAAQLDAGGLLEYPYGLAVAGTGGSRTLAIPTRVEADPYGAVVSRFALSGTVGDKVGSWSSHTLTGIPNATPTTPTSWPSYNGLARDPDGGLTLLLDEDDHLSDPVGVDDNVIVVKLDGSGADPAILASTANATGGFAARAGNFSPWASISQPAVAGTAKPAASVVALPGGRYAALFASDFAFGSSPSLPWGWKPAGGGSPLTANFAVRLLAPISAAGQPWDRTLSSPEVPSGAIANTLGNPATSGACAISLPSGQKGAENVGLAAGRDGAIWVLTGGIRAAVTGALSGGRQLIELTPGTSGQPCPQAGPALAATSGGRALDAGATNTLPAASTVDFDAAPVTGGGWAQRYAWDLDGDGTYETVAAWDAGRLHLPLDATARRQYTRAGRVVVGLRVTGDFGVVERSITLLVQAAEKPTASFTAAATAFTGDTVALDGSDSRAPTDTRLVNYHWEYGDGTADDSSGPTTDHAYAAAGSYVVRLTVRGSDNQLSVVATKTVTVTDRPRSDPPRVDPPRVDPPRSDPPRNDPPADTTAPAIALKLSGGKETLTATIGCPAGERTCSGAVTLTVKTTVTAGKGRKARRTTKTVTVGTAAYSIAGGQKKAVVVKLNAAGRALLRRAASVKVSVSVSARDAAGNAAKLKTGSATVKRAARARARRR